MLNIGKVPSTNIWIASVAEGMHYGQNISMGFRLIGAKESYIREASANALEESMKKAFLPIHDIGDSSRAISVTRPCTFKFRTFESTMIIRRRKPPVRLISYMSA